MQLTAGEEELTIEQRERLLEISLRGAQPARPDVQQDLDVLVAYGLVVRTADGRYDLTCAGRIRSAVWEGWPTNPRAGP